MQRSRRTFPDMLKEMKSLFWDTDPDQLDQRRNAPYIISRLLNMGGMAGYCWVKDLYTPEDVIWTVIHRRDLKPVVRSFMAQQLNIPKEKLVRPIAWR